MIEADFSDLTKTGLLQAHPALADGPLVVGKQVVVCDLFGPDCHLGTVACTDGPKALLSVQWDSSVSYLPGDIVFANCTFTGSSPTPCTF
jgi:hypothetical protein